jgi:transcriptional regulator with XRE-family HTH domain
METTVIQRIIEIKKNEHLTNEKFSSKANIPVETIKSMFSKKTNPNLDTIQKIYSAFPHYSLEWIICGSGEMYKKEDGERFVEIVAGKSLTLIELRREYIRLKGLEMEFNSINGYNNVAASPNTSYDNTYTVIEQLKNFNVKYKDDIDWYKKELDKKQEMIDILLSGSVIVQKNVS